MRDVTTADLGIDLSWRADANFPDLTDRHVHLDVKRVNFRDGKQVRVVRADILAGAKGALDNDAVNWTSDGSQFEQFRAARDLQPSQFLVHLGLAQVALRNL